MPDDDSPSGAAARRPPGDCFMRDPGESRDESLLRTAVESVWLAAGVADGGSCPAAAALDSLARRRWAPAVAEGDVAPAGSPSALSTADRRALRRHIRLAASALAAFEAGPEFDPEEVLESALASGAEFLRVLDRFSAVDIGVARILDEPFHLLDVGVGAAGLSTRVTRTFPGAKVHGIDVDQQMLTIAAHVVGQVGDEERITLARENIVDLEVRELYDLVWLPLGEIAATEAVPSLRAVTGALAPGGRILVTYLRPTSPDDVLGLARAWRLARSRRCTWDKDAVIAAADAEGLRVGADLGSDTTGVLSLHR